MHVLASKVTHTYLLVIEDNIRDPAMVLDELAARKTEQSLAHLSRHIVRFKEGGV